MTTPPPADNAFEQDKPGTAARDRSEGMIEGVRRLGGVFVEAVRATRVAMVLTDPALPGNPIVFANQSFLDLSGYTMEEVLGQQPYFMNGPDTDPEDAERFRQILAEDQDGAVETIQYTKNGRRFVATVLLSAFKDEHGRALHHFLTWTDVTRRTAAESEVADLKTTQAALRASERKYRTLFDTIDQGFYFAEVMLDADGRCTDIFYHDENTAAMRMTGASFKGRRLSEMGDYESYWLEIFGEVARSGQPKRLERFAAPNGVWYDFYVFKPKGEGPNGVGVVFSDVTARKEAEQALRESEERQGFLLKLSDALRATSPDTIIERAVEMLADKLALDLCYVVKVVPERDRAEVVHQLCRRTDMPGVPPTIRLSDFPQALKQWQERTLVSEDMACDPELTETDRQNVAAMRFGALIAAPVRRGPDNPIWSINAVMAQARRWTAAEIALVEETAERTWGAVEQARAEAALRESEERFRGFAENSSDALWIADAERMRLEYLSPAFERIWQRPRQPLLDDLSHWAETVHPDDRESASQAMPLVLRGEPFVSDYRITRPDGAVRHIRDTGFPIMSGGKVRRVGGIAQDLTDLRLLEQHQRTLLAELQHRVRNTLGVIRSIARRTGDTAESVDSFASHLDGRLSAFARVQALVTQSPERGISLRELVEDELLAHAAQEGDCVIIDGENIQLPPRVAERLSLAIHELATNSVKYGALQDGKACVRIGWQIETIGRERRLAFSWAETGVTMPHGERRSGFGTELLTEQLAYELKATASLDYADDGVRYFLEVPLPAAD